MSIVNIRIDERLIHGQVAAYWTNMLNVTRILVIDDLAAKDDIQKMALKMACPSTVRLSILSAQRAVERLNENAYDKDRLMIVMRGLATAKEVLDLGYFMPTINVGNISNKLGSTRIKHTVCVTPQEAEIFRYLESKGVKITIQMVHSDEKLDFMPMITHIH